MSGAVTIHRGSAQAKGLKGKRLIQRTRLTVVRYQPRQKLRKMLFTRLLTRVTLAVVSQFQLSARRGMSQADLYDLVSNNVSNLSLCLDFAPLTSRRTGFAALPAPSSSAVVIPMMPRVAHPTLFAVTRHNQPRQSIKCESITIPVRQATNSNNTRLNRQKTNKKTARQDINSHENNLPTRQDTNSTTKLSGKRDTSNTIHDTKRGQTGPATIDRN